MISLSAESNCARYVQICPADLAKRAQRLASLGAFQYQTIDQSN
jgi:hypothetical protein